MYPYTIGTLVKIEETHINGKLVDVSKENMIGYITGFLSDITGLLNALEEGKVEGNPLYQVYVFQHGRHRSAFHSYITLP